ncbi:hypothetical protein [Bifidobacterium oedipodis]|uniref:FtsK/SpoIIIE family protein n=1 Tax=Bifidobacterium oedipodis TaxID=2675322 RepID=A0A7Y0HSP4_9BIFI|nr:hypothetical protein [Bifidobacterium sp. DSM 109957]NMM94231.1 FtsK/SpoIIIE family protein [Bifidobacterium sp. DSM 109957]
MKKTNDDIVAAVLLAVLRVLLIPAVTLMWLAAFTAMISPHVSDVIGTLLCWLVPVLLSGLTMAYLAVRKRGWGWRVGCLLPVIGDVIRFRRRRARMLGNKFVRDVKLVDKADERHYHVYLYPKKGLLDIKVLPVVGFNMASLRRSAAQGLALMNAIDYSADEYGVNSYRVRFHSRADLARLRAPRELTAPPRIVAEPGRISIHVGRTLDGEAWVDFAEISGGVWAGMPGTGKSCACTLIAAGLLTVPDLVDVYVLDGKGGMDWAWAVTDGGLPKSRFVAGRAGDYGRALEVLRDVQSTMEWRLAWENQVGSFWGHGPTDRERAVVVIIDECQAWGASDGTREGKTNAAEFNALVTDLVKRGRSAGVSTLIITQKPTSDALPTAIRDSCVLRSCGYAISSETAKAALGDIPEGNPTPDLLRFEDKGMAVWRTPSSTFEIVHYDHFDPTQISVQQQADK